MATLMMKPAFDSLVLRLSQPACLITPPKSLSCTRVLCSTPPTPARIAPASSRSFRGVLLSLAASLAVSSSAALVPTFATAATIKMGADEGTLVFVPSSISVPAGEKVIFLNNKGFPHNVVFEKDGVPQGVQTETISHDDYMNEQGEQFVVTFKEKGTYKFFCWPHRSAGMFGEIIVT